MAYLFTQTPNGLPLQSRQHIDQKLWIQILIHTFEFGVAGVQGESCGFLFAGFAGAGEEVEREEFHFLESSVFALLQFVVFCGDFASEVGKESWFGWWWWCATKEFGFGCER